jgi:hypothetical protein
MNCSSYTIAVHSRMTIVQQYRYRSDSQEFVGMSRHRGINNSYTRGGEPALHTWLLN